MGQDSKISWTTHTFNPWRGCTKVSAGCKFCYADTLSKRNPKTLGVWGPNGTRVVAAESYWRQPLAWEKAAAAVGERHRVFCASLADVFEGPETMPAEAWPAVQAARDRLFALIAITPNLDWLLLTKRPENAAVYLDEFYPEGGRLEEMLIAAGTSDYSPFDDLPFTDAEDQRLSECDLLPNVWLGTSVEDQAAADERIPHLLRCPAAVRFLSCEPLLGPIDLTSIPLPAGHVCGDDAPGTFNCLDGCFQPADHSGPPFWVTPRIGWTIVGGESGPHARPMHPAWARSIRDQCAAAGVPFHFKQWGEWRPSDGAAEFMELVDRHPFAWMTPDGTTDFDAAKRGEVVEGDGTWLVRVGKHAAGRLLDGVEHNGFPTPAAVPA